MKRGMNDIKARHIKVLRDLPISEMTDEEILKAAVDRLKTKAAMLCYEDPDNKRVIFLGRYKDGGRIILRQLQVAWEEKFGEWKKIEEDI
jgi:hypothetical protein